ncbi:hypothetical protein NPIL_342271, partial [Nephila pilipes]
NLNVQEKPRKMKNPTKITLKTFAEIPFHVEELRKKPPDFGVLSCTFDMHITQMMLFHLHLWDTITAMMNVPVQ